MISVEWTEFFQEVESDCNTIEILKPEQIVSHRKKCLLSTPDADLDPEVLQDLKPGETYDGPIHEIPAIATSDENDESGQTNGSASTPFMRAVQHLKPSWKESNYE